MTFANRWVYAVLWLTLLAAPGGASGQVRSWTLSPTLSQDGQTIHVAFSPLLGATLAPVDNVLRAQLGLAEKQGLVITHLNQGGPLESSGLKKHDILLSFNDQPLHKTGDFQTALASAKSDTAVIKLVREGAKLTLAASLDDLKKKAPRSKRVQLVQAVLQPGYYIGVSVSVVDATVKSQLKIKHGLVVTEVTEDSPAQKAGVKPHDILLGAGDKNFSSVTDLQETVNSSKGKPIQVRYLRSGKEQTVEVTPAVREAGYTLRYVPSMSLTRDRSGVIYQVPMAVVDKTRLFKPDRATLRKKTTAKPPSETVESQLGEMAKQIKQLRQAIEQLRSEIKKKPD